MTAGLPAPFPDLSSVDSEDRNPAIRLFGKRFFVDQSALELLAEFLAVAFCEKRIGSVSQLGTPLPAHNDLSAWPRDVPLEYRPPVKLNLKLFAFLGASRIDTRHAVHLQQYERLAKRLESRIRTNDGNAGQVVEWIEELLRGFQGAGFNRTWCAQTFLPISKALLTQETLWNETIARREAVADWYESVNRFHKYYSVSRHRFLARGGEVLYLQLCNALATDPSTITSFVHSLRGPSLSFVTDKEADPRLLHTLLGEGFAGLGRDYTAAFDRLVDAIEDLDTDTKRAVSGSMEGASWLSCEWCPRESWQEGYLFAIELSRVLRAALDPVERLEMLTTGCALQVLRSLCAQSARYAGQPRASSPLGYAWLLTPQEGAPKPLRLASQRNLQRVQGLIQRALRTEALRENARHSRVPEERLYAEADSKYGHKLLLSLGKKLGLIVPRRGPGARFTLTDDILRYLVLALLRPGERCTYDDFLQRLYLHYGIAVEGDHLSEAAAWSGLPASRSIQPGNGGWLAAGLRAGGFLTELSDACSVVRNTYAPADDRRAGERA